MNLTEATDAALRSIFHVASQSSVFD